MRLAYSFFIISSLFISGVAMAMESYSCSSDRNGSLNLTISKTAAGFEVLDNSPFKPNTYLVTKAERNEFEDMVLEGTVSRDYEASECESNTFELALIPEFTNASSITTKLYFYNEEKGRCVSELEINFLDCTKN